MEAFGNAWQVVSVFLVFALGLFIAIVLSRYFRIGGPRGCLLYVWHTLFCVLYFLYVSSNGGDSLGYYRRALDGFVEFGVGTPAVVNINAIFAGYMGFSFLGVFLVNNIFGCIGLLAFYGALRRAVENKAVYYRRLALFTVLLPSVSFWSSALGKDSISFMAAGLLLWSALNIRKRALLLALAIFMMFLVRPHMAGLMVIALAVAFVFSGHGGLVSRLLLGLCAAVATAVMVPFALNYVGLEDGSVESFGDYVDERQSVNLHGGGSVDISSMSPPMQLFTYLFRPLPFEASSVFQLAASVDNLLLLYLAVLGVHAWIRGRKSHLREYRVFLWVYVLLAWAILSMTTANLGISMRQKWMFTPILIFLFFSLIGRRARPRVDYSVTTS